MEIMRGTFTGIGVGPGDPELLTLKAVRMIRECHVAAVPVSDPGLAGPVCEEAESLSSDSSCAAYLEKCAAYQIALRAVPELASKPKLFLPMPMIKDKAVLKEIHDRDASAAAELLDGGRDIVFLTLGDPTVYSTCMYVHKRLARAGYLTALVPGIPSFCVLKVVLPVFYARKIMTIPLYSSLLSIAANIVLNLILMWPLKQGGIALATVFASMLNNAILLTCLHREGFQLQGRRMCGAFLRALLFSLAVGVPLFFAYPLLRGWLSFRFVGEFPAFCVLVLCFCAGYFGLHLLFRTEEPREFFGMLRHRS